MSEGGATEEFRAYLAPLAVESGSARVAERWSGIVAWAENDAVASHLPALVATMRDVAGEGDRTQLAPFYSAQVNADETFSTLNAGQLLRILAAAALDYLFTHNGRLDTCAALAVVTSSWAGRAPNGLAVDILGRAEAELDNIAQLARNRSDLKAAIKEFAPSSLPATTPAITRINEGSFDHATTFAAFDELQKAVSKSLSAHALGVRKLLTKFADQIDQCDEEIDVLWYVFGGVSADAGAPFSTLDPGRASFCAAREIASITSRPLRTNAAMELFRRCGAKGRKLVFAEAVEAMSAEWIAEHVVGEFSPSLFPIHRAMARYSAIAESGAWIAGWSQATGIAGDHKVDPTELALAFYRERLLRQELS